MFLAFDIFIVSVFFFDAPDVLGLVNAAVLALYPTLKTPSIATANDFGATSDFNTLAAPLTVAKVPTAVVSNAYLAF